MAYRRSNGKGRRKIEPAVKRLAFELPVAASATVDFYIDLSQCASLVNRRFYRQGINWAVSGMKVLSESATTLDASINVTKLPETWVMSNAWEKGFRAWERMNNEALDESESVRPRFLDFKIFADAAHHTAGYAANLLPLSSAGTYVAGEWESSKMRIPVGSANPGQTTDREIVATGANYPGNGASGLNAVSLIEGYAASRGLPNVLDPNAPDDADSVDGTTPANWMAATFNEGTEQKEAVLEDMITENNIAPYPFENDGVNADTMYPGGANQGIGLAFHDTEYITGTTVGGTTRLQGGLFPCGLIKISITNSSASSLGNALYIDLVPGHHRGYLCEPMTEM